MQVKEITWIFWNQNLWSFYLVDKHFQHTQGTKEQDIHKTNMIKGISKLKGKIEILKMQTSFCFIFYIRFVNFYIFGFPDFFVFKRCVSWVQPYNINFLGKFLNNWPWFGNGNQRSVWLEKFKTKSNRKRYRYIWEKLFPGENLDDIFVKN